MHHEKEKQHVVQYFLKDMGLMEYVEFVTEDPSTFIPQREGKNLKLWRTSCNSSGHPLGTVRSGKNVFRLWKLQNELLNLKIGPVVFAASLVMALEELVLKYGFRVYITMCAFYKPDSKRVGHRS